MRMLINRKNQGITLVALIITIIILLILAGISIAQLTGNGLFEKAKLAKQKSENAQIEENKILSQYQDTMDEYVESNRETIKVNKEEYEQLLKDVANLKEQNEKDNNSWKLYKTVTGATEIDISNLDFQELRLVCTAHRGSTFNDNWVLTQDILESDLSTERTDIYCAGFGNGSTVNQFLVKCSKGKVKLTYMIISGKDYISSAVTKVYYK